ncbi:hypothetical protein [Nonomuraea sp. B19D2]|uniref:hypothetical protein n=1 Tax=Nonomuraea sp. B19D2 TaxID=3159561 RepID=UPI0032DAC02F
MAGSVRAGRVAQSAALLGLYILGDVPIVAAGLLSLAALALTIRRSPSRRDQRVPAV